MITLIKRWFSFPVFPHDEEKTRRASLLNALLPVVLLFSILIIFGNFLGGKTLADTVAVVLLISIVFLQLRYWLHRGEVNYVGAGLVSIVFLFITITCISHGTVRTLITAAYLFWILIVDTLFDIKGLVVSTAATLLAVLGILLAENAGLLPPPDYMVTVTEWFAYVIFLGLSVGLVYYTNRTLRNALGHAQQEIEKRQRIEHDLHVNQVKLEMQNDELHHTHLYLDAARARYFDLYDFAPVGYVTLDEMGVIVQSNIMAATLLGVKRRELESQSISRFIHDEDQDKYHFFRKRVMEMGETQSGELRMVKKSGEQFWVQIDATVADGKDGLPVYYSVVLFDISKRKRAEESLQKRIKELDCLYAIADVIEKDDNLEKVLQGTVDLLPRAWFYAEIACARIILDEQEFRTANFHKTAQSQSADIHLLGKTIGIVELCYLKETHLPFLVEETNLINAIADRLGRFIGHKRAIEALRENEMHHRALLNAIPDIILRIRRDGTFLDFKPNTADSFNFSRQEVVGNSVQNAFNGSLTERMMPCIENALQSGEVQTIEYSLKIGDSTHVFETRFKDSGVDEVTAIVRDVSERARLEQMKSDFINRAIHELRMPIATIVLMVTVIDGNNNFEGEYKECWEILKSELEREQILIEDLLTAGRLESDQFGLRFSSFDLTEVITGVIQQLESSTEDRNIKIRLQTQSGSDTIIEADEKALTQVFTNLLGNAVKFSHPDTEVNIFLKQADGGFEISIIDTGIGIPSEDLPLLFTRFFRASNAIENEIQGTGIGLFIVRSLLEKHDGKIKVSSEAGKGTRFDIWLPVTQRRKGNDRRREPR